MFDLMIVLLAAYLCYQGGVRYMLRSRIMDKNKAAQQGYVLFMLAGTILGEFIGLSLAFQYAPESGAWQIVCGTVGSILLGEAFYFYNKRVIRKIPTMEQRKNY